jgi:leader peptidase (prepilin peptidase)/N-methyltransferase
MADARGQMPKLQSSDLGAIPRRGTSQRAFVGARVLASRDHTDTSRLSRFRIGDGRAHFIDAEHMILPNVITYPLLVIALLIRIIFPIVFVQNYFSDTMYVPAVYLAGQPAWLVSLFGAIVGALVGGGSLWLVGALWKKLRGVDAMGLGDVKMMFGVGALLGWRLAFLSIFLGAFSGALIGVVLIAKQKDKDLQTQIPFGIFLGTGSILALLFGDQLIAWYVGTFV